MTARRLSILVMGLTFLAWPAAAGSLEGRWRLVEQSAGTGDAELLPDAPLELEFYRDGRGLAGRLRQGADGSASLLDWPALLGEGDRAVSVVEVVVAAEQDGIRARYRTAHDGESEPIEIVEDYRVADGGRALVGEVTVAVPGGGSYTLRRRFERMP